MTDLEFIKAIQKVLSPNEKGDKPSLINALELVEQFKKSVIKEYLKTKRKRYGNNHNDTET